MLIKAYGSAVQGINATIITIEVKITYGIRFFIVGLADNAVKESQKRIFSNRYKLYHQIEHFDTTLLSC